MPEAKRWHQRIPSVLIVEDSKEIAMMIREIVYQMGLRIAGIAAAGIDGANLYIKYKPDLVLLDIQLPQGNGLTILRLIREIDPNAKVIMLTGEVSKHTVLTAKKLGAVAYISKENYSDKLREEIEQILDL